MGRGKEFTMTELNEIRSFLNDGCSYTEIAELMGRSKKSIEIAVWRYRLKEKKNDDDKNSLFNDVIEQMSEKAQFTSDVTTDEPRKSASVKEILESVDPKLAEENVVYKEKIVYKEKTLNDFTPREMFKNLSERGYIFKPGSVTCKRERVVVEEVPVNVEDMING